MVLLLCCFRGCVMALGGACIVLRLVNGGRGGNACQSCVWGRVRWRLRVRGYIHDSPSNFPRAARPHPGCWRRGGNFHMRLLLPNSGPISLPNMLCLHLGKLLRNFSQCCYNGRFHAGYPVGEAHNHGLCVRVRTCRALNCSAIHLVRASRCWRVGDTSWLRFLSGGGLLGRNRTHWIFFSFDRLL